MWNGVLNTSLGPSTCILNLSGIPDTETSGKDTDSEAEGMSNMDTRFGLTPHHQKMRRAKQDASIVMHSLQLVAEELRKIHKLKIWELNGGYSANAKLVFNSWLKDMEMCIREWNLPILEAVQLIKDYTMENARGTVEFYLDTNSTQEYQDLIEHLRILLESGKMYSSLVGDFYSWVQWTWETEDQFTNKLQKWARN